ncbi:MAG: hypothetical protein ACP5L5_10860 [Vulcanisaeta sp.]|uniref:hypothetical protein n=1 Tax=Vulcanisaeta sp. TaxID=2020871 RepID=UPI003D14190B
MGRKSYNGYHSWSFLEPNKDYRPFKLAKEVGRVPSSKVELSKVKEERVGKFIERHILISLHDHLQIYPENPSEYFEYTWRNRPFIGYEGLAASGLDAVFDGLLDGESIMTKDPLELG